MSHADLLRLVHPLKGNQRGTIPDLLRGHLMSQPPNRIKIEVVDRHLQNFESKVGLIRPLSQACSQMPPPDSRQMLEARHSCRDGLLKSHCVGRVPCDPHTECSGCPSKSTQYLWLDQIIPFHLLVTPLHTGMDNRFSFV